MATASQCRLDLWRQQCGCHVASLTCEWPEADRIWTHVPLLKTCFITLLLTKLTSNIVRCPCPQHDAMFELAMYFWTISQWRTCAHSVSLMACCDISVPTFLPEVIWSHTPHIIVCRGQCPWNSHSPTQWPSCGMASLFTTVKRLTLCFSHRSLKELYTTWHIHHVTISNNSINCMIN